MVNSVITLLKSDLIEGNPEKYSFVLDFVSCVLSRNKYKNDENDILAKITQRFVDEDVIWFFKEKMVKAVEETNRIFCNADSLSKRSSSLKSQTSKTAT